MGGCIMLLYERATETDSRMSTPHRNAPDGWAYSTDFLTVPQEDALLAHFQTLPFEAAQYKEWQARRRMVAFGGRYDFSRNELSAASPIPEFLLPLRQHDA
jgi:hypothetical protein